jgi:putative phosphoserine phosphatase/1-acylglycerol-3-phosphate O-acyltransferase
VNSPAVHERIIEEIHSGPTGPQVAAFFDYEALIDQHGIPGDGPERYRGMTASDAISIGAKRFTDAIAGMLSHDAWRLVRAHANKEHTVVITGSGSRFDVEPLASELNVQHVLCNEPTFEDGVIADDSTQYPLDGLKKAELVRDFARHNGIDVSASHAYAHNCADLPLLETVGHPHPVHPDPDLAAFSQLNGWPILTVSQRRHGNQIMATARTAAMLGTLAIAGGAGFAAGLGLNSRRTGVDVGTWLFGRLGTLAGDLKVDIIGEEHVWSHRPAVFLANHQSTLIDVLVTARILQRGFTIVAKAEAKDMPLVGPLFSLADVAFVDRADTSKAISALQPAVDKLREGTSIAMSPEGTRSLTPRVGTFKKGGFHLARDAGVPIVPIVIRNAGEIMWRNAKVAQAGTVEVRVHHPLPTTGWAISDIKPWLESMHDLYIDTLDDWPGTAAAARWQSAVTAADASRY